MWTTLSKTLDMVGRTDIGQFLSMSLPMSFALPFLNNGFAYSYFREFFFLRSTFAFIQALHWLSSLSDILAPQDLNRDSHAYNLFTILCVAYAAVIYIRQYFVSWRYWLNILLTWSLFILHNFFATARKIIYAACLIWQADLLVKIDNARVHESSCEFRWGAGSFPKQRLVINWA